MRQAPGVRRRERGLLGGAIVGSTALAVIALALALCAPAEAQIYWANEGGDSIGHASLDGVTVDQDFISGASNPRAVAIDASHIYWAHDGGGGGSIGRAELDGVTGLDQAFIEVGTSPQGVTLDASQLYWAHTVSGAGKIGRAGIDGSGANQSFISAGSSPCGLATDGDEVYWARSGSPGVIASAHGAFTINPSFITATDDPCGVAVAGGYIYWANRAGDSIGRATLDGTTEVDQDFIETTTSPCGVAVDEQHVYWTTGDDAIARADVDGTDPNEDFITGAEDPCGLAVTPTLEADPSSYDFPETEVGGESAIYPFVTANTSSSVLDVSGVELAGADPGDFEITGDGCTTAVAAAGGGCIINLRFTPTAEGGRSATLQVSSNADESPSEITLSGEGVPDVTAPAFLSAEIRPATFAVDPGGAPETPLRAAEEGTRFRYSLSEAARVTFTIKRKIQAGDFRRVGRFADEGVAGLNKKPFSGKIGDHSLQPDSYLARLGARDHAGKRGEPRFLHFHVEP